jgi:hypothetical protein
MVYFVALGVLVLVIWGIAKAASGDRYSKMSEEEFEAEAKRASPIGAAVAEFQKTIDPSHRVEYQQEQELRVEADGAEAGDGPKAGRTTGHRGTDSTEKS